MGVAATKVPPQAMRNVISALLISFTLCGSLVADVDVGNPTEKTPYDRVFGNMRQVYSHFGTTEPSISEVRAQLRTAHRFRYYFDKSDPYTPQLPEVTEAKKEGDCKAKSLWLADKMHTRSARYTIGKAKLDSKLAHAWLMWPNNGTWLLLDPVCSAEPIEAEKVVGKILVPKFSFVGSRAWRHPTYSTYIPN